METRITILKLTLLGALFCAVVVGFAAAFFMHAQSDGARDRYQRLGWFAIIGWFIASVAGAVQLYWIR